MFRTLSAASLVVLAGCGGSTGPRQSPTQVAAYYDALAGTRLAAGTNYDTLAAHFIEVLNGPIAYGQLPTALTITASGTRQRWLADAAWFVDSARTDSSLVIMIWQDTTVSQYMLGIGTAFGFYRIAQGVVSAVADTSTVTTTASLRGGPCTNTPITHVFSQIPTYDPAHVACQPGIVVIGGHLHFHATNGIDTSYQDLDLESATISAVRLQDLHGAIN
jgi:hypothetical protein